MKSDVLWKTILVLLPFAGYLSAQAPGDIIIDEENVDIFDDDLILEEGDYDDWTSTLDDYYVPIGMEGPISPPEAPSILDSGTYSTQVSFEKNPEEHGVEAVTIH